MTYLLVKGVIKTRKNKNCKLAKFKQIGIHDFRHSCASLLINYGASITLIAKYLGHTKIDETLNTYSHMYKNKLDDIVELINKNNHILIENDKQSDLNIENEINYNYEKDYSNDYDDFEYENNELDYENDSYELSL